MTLEDKGLTFSNLAAFKEETDKIYLSNNCDQNFNDIQKVQAQNNLISKLYDSTNFSGLGKKVLSKNIQTINGELKNILTQASFQDEDDQPITDTVFVIQYDFDLNDQIITIPSNCTLEFDGGSLNNGQIVSDKTYVKNYTINCAHNLYVTKGFIPVEYNSNNTGKIILTLECFGDYKTNALTVLNLALHQNSNHVVYVNEDITLDLNGNALNIVSNYTTLASQNNSTITFTGTVTFYASSFITIKDIHLHFNTPSQYDQLYTSNCNHVIIENCEISGTFNDNDGLRYGGGIHVLDCTNVTIRNNRIHDVFLNGILVHNNCTYIDIIDNFVDGSTNIGIEIEGRGGGLGTTKAYPCSNITIIGNLLFNCTDAGINVNFSNTAEVIGNIIKYTRIGVNCISNQNVIIDSNVVLSNGSALLIDLEFFGDIALTNQDITVSNNVFQGGITNNLTGQGKVINALVPIQNASNIKLTNNTFFIHRLVDGRTKDNDCIIAILSSNLVKVLNNKIVGFSELLPTRYNTGILIGRSYKVLLTNDYYEVTDELLEIPSDIKISNNTIINLAYGISTIRPNSGDVIDYTDGIENKVDNLLIYKNTIKNCYHDVYIGGYSTNWSIDDNVLIDNTSNHYLSSGTTAEIPQIMTGALKGMKYFDTSLNVPVFWSGNKFKGNNGWVDGNGGSVTKRIPGRIAYFGNSLLLGYNYGMAATAVDKDYYYYLNEYFKDRNIDFSASRIGAQGFESATSDAQADSGMWNLLEYLMSGCSAIIILCGDNVNTADLQSYFTQYGAKRLLHTIRQYLPNVKIYWVGLWFDKPDVYNAIVDACNEEGANLVDIRDLSTYTSSIGTVRKYNESATYTKLNVTNVSADGDNITITFHVYDTDYTTTIKCSSYSLNSTTLTYTGYETYVDDYGESIHPSDTGFKLIANRILQEVKKDF